MRVLLIKTSSMGDIIHTLPALTDASQAIPGIEFDWLIEEAFAAIPQWHSAVKHSIPVALRRWRKTIFSHRTYHEFKHLRTQLQQVPYDIILDAQGLVKSAFLGFFAQGKRVGLDWHSAREMLASAAYQETYQVNFYQHAVVRMRSLLSQALHYPLPTTPPEFGLKRQLFLPDTPATPYLVFLHGTTWRSKQWPESYWQQLAAIAANAGFRIKISGGNDEEVQRAIRIAQACSEVDLLPYLEITGMATLLAQANGVVTVDTGLGHLAAALSVPTISLYGPTHPEYTGALGRYSLPLAANFSCAPCLRRHCHYKKPADVQPACFTTLQPLRVWNELVELMNQANATNKQHR